MKISSKSLSVLPFILCASICSPLWAAGSPVSLHCEARMTDDSENFGKVVSLGSVETGPNGFINKMIAEPGKKNGIQVYSSLGGGGSYMEVRLTRGTLAKPSDEVLSLGIATARTTVVAAKGNHFSLELESSSDSVDTIDTISCTLR